MKMSNIKKGKRERARWSGSAKGQVRCLRIKTDMAILHGVIFPECFPFRAGLAQLQGYLAHKQTPPRRILRWG